MPAALRPLLRPLVALIALAMIVVSLSKLAAQDDGLVVTREAIPGAPLTLWRLPGEARRPVVVIAHGFAGSQQLMQPFATTLARSGYLAVTFDFPGHGRNPRPLKGGLATITVMREDLSGTLDAVVAHARTLPGSDGRVGLLGHSMAAEAVVRYADGRDDIDGTVAVSLFVPEPRRFAPRNLLIVDGALESPMLRQQGIDLVASATGEAPLPATTYGRFEDGSARRIAFAPGAEHIGVLYSRATLIEARQWFDQVFRHPGGADTDARGRWIGWFLAGVVLLAWPLAALLPRAATPPAPPTPDRRWFWFAALMPALLTPPTLWRVPSEFLPLLLGDYLALHFAVYGLFTAVIVWALGARLPPSAPIGTRPLAFALSVAAMAGYSLAVLGFALDAFVVSFMPAPWRLPLVAALIAGLLPWFLADEWLTRRIAPRRGAYLLTKACFLLSLLIAIALNLEKLFFLVIIVPAILLLFVVYGLFSSWAHRASAHPLVAASANAIVFAWAIAMTFPVVAR